MRPLRLTLVLLSVATISLVGWRFLADPLMRGGVKYLYDHPTVPLLGRLMSGRSSHPVSHYLEVWAGFSRLVFKGLAVVWAVILVVSRPEFRRLIDWISPIPAEIDTYAISPRRKILVASLFALILIPHAIVLVSQKWEAWPFLRYPIFPDAKRDRVVRYYRAEGILPNGGEFPLTRSEYTAPLDPSRLHAMVSVLNRDLPSPEQYHRAAADMLKRYESLRLKGRHDGPAINGLRIYRVIWDLDSRAANVDAPTSKTLIAEAFDTVPSGDSTR